MKTRLIAGLCLLAGLASAVARAETEHYTLDTHGIDFTIDVTRRPLFPPSMLNEGYLEGKVRIAMEVDHTGELRDWMDLEASHPDFVEAIARVIHSWEFSPPKINGKSRTVVTYLDINFSAKGAVLSFDLTTGMDMARMNQIFGYNREKEELTSAHKLDTPIRPIHQVNPAVPLEAIKEHEGSKARFTFFVDEWGKVRMPTLDRIDGDVELGMVLAAQDALSQWQFTRPTSGSRPTRTKLAQEFVFINR
ncbi:energy transducer TonB [Pelagicoccus sp. SDUM812003]|nr:energy transducer TonB [Pelagicoccus sp. SDUM812003]